MIKRFDLAWITVSDIKQAKKFYVEQLGFIIANEAPEYGWMELQAPDGGAYLGIAQANEYGKEPGHNAIGTFTVNDIVSEKERLQKQNVTFIGEIMEVPGHVKLATFKDADGNQFQLAEMLPNT